MADALIAIAAYAIGINLAGFLAFAWDKHCARNGMWRVPERTLLTLAAVGGTVGAIVGQRALRHKTWKEPFRTNLIVIVVIQVVVLLALSFPQVRNALWTSSQQTSSPRTPPLQSQRAQPLHTSGKGAIPQITRH